MERTLVTVVLLRKKSWSSRASYNDSQFMFNERDVFNLGLIVREKALTASNSILTGFASFLQS